MTVEFEEPALGLRGFLCIHTMGRLGACGGIRLASGLERPEVEAMARAMAYKYAFFRIEQGGAKAGLQWGGSSPAQSRESMLRAAARHFEPVIKSGIWSPGTDLGFNVADLGVFLSSIGVTVPPRIDGGSSFRTAVSVFASLECLVAWLSLVPNQVKISLEGFGGVGRYLAPFLQRAGIRVVAVSTESGCVVRPDGLDLAELLRRQSSGAPGWIQSPGPWTNRPREALFDQAVDVILPGARAHSIDEQLAERLEARAILPIANVPCTDGALSVLDRRGILVVPDYVANGGGVCGHVMAGASPANPGPTDAFVACYQPMVRRLLEAAAAQGVAPRRLADAVAHQGYQSMTKNFHAGTSPGARALRLLEKCGLPVGSSAGRDRSKRAVVTIAHLDSLYR